MKAESKHIQVNKTARFTHLKSENKTNTKALIVLHGYGQLSTYFSKKFNSIDSGYDFIIAEGLNRFYVSGSSGRVGASWMTKEDRLMDIADNQNYIQKLIDFLMEQYSDIALLGFSQGGATAARFYFEKPNSLTGLILWGSVFPPDVAFPTNIIDTQNCYFVLGDKDPYFTSEKQKEVLTLHENLGMNILQFDGKHDIDGKTLETILLNF